MQSLTQIDWQALTGGRTFQPSPDAWVDQTFYFLLVDRFSNGRECSAQCTALCGADERERRKEQPCDGTPLFHAPTDEGMAHATVESARRWCDAGQSFVGGTLRGIRSKLDYLAGLGVTALWISPILKQCPWSPGSYHGYATQDFLAIDPHFGTIDDLRDLVDDAHARGLYVVLDIVVNHAGDVFAYDPALPTVPSETPGPGNPPWSGAIYPTAGLRDKHGEPSLPFDIVDTKRFPDAHPDGAIWPRELQSPECFTRKGCIVDWDRFPEFEEGDFFALKDFCLDSGDQENFAPSPALCALVDIYRYWIAAADLDGFRIDTVKHMGEHSVAHFVQEIRAYARSLGKNNFLQIGEIVGARSFVLERLQATGLSAALGLHEIPSAIRGIVTGHSAPADYFSWFGNTPAEADEGEAMWWRNRVVTLFDDHDQVGRSVKARFAAEFAGDVGAAISAIRRAMAFQLFTVGIPCLYYGTEQGLNGHAPKFADEFAVECADRYLREAMFGGEFGPFGSSHRHCFDPEHPLYQSFAAMTALRRAHPALRRGRQFLREISENGVDFGVPAPGDEPYRGLIAWSRLLDIDEFVCVINTDSERSRCAWVRLDPDRHGCDGRPLRVVYADREPDQPLPEVCVEERDGCAAKIALPPGGVLILR